MNKLVKGNAYILVMIATMAMLMLVSTLLLITVNSRYATERHIDFAGLYDLAVAGNENAFALLQQGGLDNLRNYFIPFGLEYMYNWEFSVVINLQDGRSFYYQYHGITVVRPMFDSFIVHTRVSRQGDEGLSFPVTVQGNIIWATDNIIGNGLDYSMLKMVELLRVAD